MNLSLFRVPLSFRAGICDRKSEIRTKICFKTVYLSYNLISYNIPFICTLGTHKYSKSFFHETAHYVIFSRILF